MRVTTECGRGRADRMETSTEVGMLTIFSPLKKINRARAQHPCPRLGRPLSDGTVPQEP